MPEKALEHVLGLMIFLSVSISMKIVQYYMIVLLR